MWTPAGGKMRQKQRVVFHEANLAATAPKFLPKNFSFRKTVMKSHTALLLSSFILLVFPSLLLAEEDFINGIPITYYLSDLDKPTYHVVDRFNFKPNTATIQKYLTQILDWNWKLTPEEELYYCHHRMDSILQMAENVSSNEFFWDTNPNHMKLVMDISTALNDENTATDAISLAACMRDVINAKGWLRGLSTTMTTGRMDLRGYYTQSLLEVFPSELVNDAAIFGIRDQANFGPTDRQCVPVNGEEGRDNGIENLLWYWREDVMINSFHWYWHLAYPFMGTAPRADRRGELFYYVHHTIVARYRTERMSVGLPSLVPLELFPGQVIDEGYNPHLTDTNSANNWTPRRPRRVIRDTATRVVTGTDRVVIVEERLRQIAAIEEAIAQGFAVSTAGTPVPLRTARGIDILGDMVEAAMWTINQDLYGFPGPHNDGHFLIGLIEDQNGVRGIPPGVMADPATAVRDPVFYRYHLAVDAIFNRHKRTLPPYQPFDGDFPLVFPGIQMVDFVLKPFGAATPNRLETFFVDQVYDVSRGLDFNGTLVDGAITACVKHIDHQRFNYEITIDRAASATSRATIRIFIAPRFNELGERFSMDDQRLLFFQLDRFPVNLVPGLNRVIRDSTESTLTIPFPQSFAEFQNDLANETPNCGCGWPQHLLMPRGRIEGETFDLFVMVTDGDVDAVQFTANVGPGAGCRPAPIFCGIVDQRYPDARPMGYPFDRLPYVVDGDANGLEYGQPRPVQTIEEYVIGIPNSALIQIEIFHRGGDDPSTLALQSKAIHSFVPFKHRYTPYLNPFLDPFKR